MTPIEFVKRIKAEDYNCTFSEGTSCIDCPFVKMDCGFSHRWAPGSFARRMKLVDKFLELEAVE